MNRVLVVGHASSHARHLVADVTGVDGSAWTVETRYFSAPVQFVFHDLDAEKREEASETAEWAGLVLVFDPSGRHESSARPHFWDEWANVAPDAGVRALVAHASSDEDALTEGRFDAYAEWCVEHGLELMEANMESSPPRGLRRLLDGDPDDAEPRGEGKQRLYEALVSNMWPFMQKKERKEEEGVRAVDSAAAAAVVETAATPLVGVAPDVPPEFDFRALIEGRGGGGSDPAAEDADEQTLEAFEQALTRAREMRLHAQELPDDERREFASKMVLHLMSLMGEMGDENDEEE